MVLIQVVKNSGVFWYFFSSAFRFNKAALYFVEVRMKKAGKIHKPLHLWSLISTKGIIFKWTWHPAPPGPL